MRNLLKLIAIVVGALPAYAQPGLLRNGAALIGADDLPPQFAAALQKLGGRMMGNGNAATTLSGTVTDSSGSRPAQITAQAPGYLRYQETGGNSRIITFDGGQFRGNGNTAGADDDRVRESLLADLPDTMFLQLAGGGGCAELAGISKPAKRRLTRDPTGRCMPSRR